MRGLDNVKTDTIKKIRGNRNVVSTNLKKAKKSNETLLRETRSLVKRIRKYQAARFGHVMRREKLEHRVTTGVVEGKHTCRENS